MGVRDPKDVRSRGGQIILPGEQRADDLAARQFQVEQALKNHPFYAMIEGLRHDRNQLMVSYRGLQTRFNALVDYLHDNGFLTTQPLDPDTGLVSETVASSTPEKAELFFDHLIDHNILEKMPKYGLERYIEEYLQHDALMHRVAMARETGAKMEKVLELLREFNNSPRRLRKVTAAAVGLPQYLSLNPDGLSEEEIEAIAEEFGLYKAEEAPVEEPPKEAENV
jgi:hypothetical protein